mgnify:CR=1 FL=1
MSNTPPRRWPLLGSLFGFALLLGACASQPAEAPAASPASAAPAATLPVDAALRTQAQAEVAPFLKTLESLVAIESGSRDLEGLATLRNVVAERLRQCGQQV